VLGYNLYGEFVLGIEGGLPTFLDKARDAIGIAPQAWLGLVAFLGMLYLLVFLPLKASREES
jgi:hypothetical protein